MSRRRIVGYLALCALVALLGAVAFAFANFKDHRVAEGEAYGFRIGESVAQTYDRALGLHVRGEFVEFRLGQGSSAQLLNPSHPETALAENHWQLVVDPDAWNDSIYLSFENHLLSEIWRFRLCCELP